MRTPIPTPPARSKERRQHGERAPHPHRPRGEERRRHLHRRGPGPPRSRRRSPCSTSGRPASIPSSFAFLAAENSADTGSASNGGLYEEIYPGQTVDAFDAWCFDASRQPGDTDIVETQYGYHVMYFSSVCEHPYWYVAPRAIISTSSPPTSRRRSPRSSSRPKACRTQRSQISCRTEAARREVLPHEAITVFHQRTPATRRSAARSWRCWRSSPLAAMRSRSI